MRLDRLEFDNKLDKAGDLEITMWDDVYPIVDWINKDDAIAIISHLQKCFDLEV